VGRKGIKERRTEGMKGVKDTRKESIKVFVGIGGRVGRETEEGRKGVKEQWKEGKRGSKEVYLPSIHPKRPRLCFL
jgi:hypothetical protein